MKKTPELLAHLEWLGYIQPVGLVVSAPALLNAQAHINANVVPEHRRFLDSLRKNEDDETIAEITDFHSFVQSVFGWEREDLRKLPLDSLPADFNGLEIVLPEYNETLRPTYVVPAFEPADDEPKWIALVKEYTTDVELDDHEVADNRKWQASPHSRMERLLRETGVSFGILTNGRSIRLVYAPRGETSGYLTFNLDEMITVAGRPIFAAMHLLLGAPLMFSNDKHQRLPAILADSRKYQNTVSTELAEQVMSALFDLLRGFQSASDATGGQLLGSVLTKNPQHVYHALVTVLMRMVFVLYAEDRGLVSGEAVYTNHYSVSGLFERLRQDYGRFPDTMDQRFGAWAQLLALFRMIYEGGSHDELRIPAREGYLFDYQRFPFLEGRYDDGNPRVLTQEEIDSPINVPRVSDGVVYSMLNNLLILQGERLSYRTLDVEQIGSVYEAIMGFSVEVSTGKSIAIKPVKKHGAPSTINLEELLAVEGKDRSKWIKEKTDQKLSAGDAKNVKAATSIEELISALGKKIATHVTPDPVPAGAMIFQPSDERRRSGSHYTPRSLTEPIVKTTLEPILTQQIRHPEELKQEETEAQKDDSNVDESDEQSASQSSGLTTAVLSPKVVAPRAIDKSLKKRLTKGELAARERIEEQRAANHTAAIRIGVPHPSQILDLKICDPAMGSGAFLVEVCRQLAEELVRSWYAHDMFPPNIPPDEDELLYARRLIAQRCLYGVDKNFMAVELAKLSLWLVTLAADHAFTFLDHSLCHGDSLVGLSREQIIGFHWEVKKQKKFGEDQIQRRLDRATESRAKILNAREDVPYKDQQSRMALADDALDIIRTIGDACVSAFFAGSKKKEREEEVQRLQGIAADYVTARKANDVQLTANSSQSLRDAASRLQTGPHPIPVFHWEIEFPEVFARENSGFDAFVGNPPFLGGARIWASLGTEFPDWLREVHENSKGKAVDLIAHFFRRTFNLLRADGCIGLIATNTLAQGDTREAGLRHICLAGGSIYNATRRLRWPGQAAVIVSVVHLSKGNASSAMLDGERVAGLNSFLFARSTEFDPKKLKANTDVCFRGCDIYGQGFVFSDEEKNAVTNPICLMDEFLASNPSNKSVIFPYIGGKEINSDPQHKHHRYVINFAQMSLEEAKEWPDLVQLVREKVKPERDKLGGYSVAERRRDYWWQYGTYTPALYNAIMGTDRVLAISQTTKYIAFCFLPSQMVFSHKLLVLRVRGGHRDFGILQSRIHEVWATFLGSSMKDDPVYSPPDCFETFPFPDEWLTNSKLEDASRSYYEFRAKQFVTSSVGMTETYNRFHSPDLGDEGVVQLRRLHSLLDETVLLAYGWGDLADRAATPGFCQFIPDYEEEESDEPGAKKSKKKKPWRYRWPEEFRDEVLARLLELNEQRHQEELLAGGVAKAKKVAKPRVDSTDKKLQSKGLFDDLPELDANEKLILMAVQEIGTMTRFTLNNAFCLLKSNKCRKAILGLGEPPAKTPNALAGMDTIVGRLISAKWLRVIPSDSQQILTLGEVESPLGAISKSDRTKVEEVKQVFAQEMAKAESKLEQFEVEDDLVGETDALKIKKGVFHAKESLLV